jgi:hypothetical protein
MIHGDEEGITRRRPALRVVPVQFDEEDESPFVGLLRIEAA